MKEIKYNQYTKDQIGHQSGLSLVELLVSTVIGLFLLAGVATHFVSTKNSDKMRDAISDMDANARTAFDLLRNTIRHAGYPSKYSKTIDKPFFTNSSPGVNAPPNTTCRGSIKLENQPPAWNRRSRDGTSDVLTSIYLADNPCVSGVPECENTPANFNPSALIYSDCTGGGATRDKRAVACSADPVNGIASPASPSDAKIYSTFRVIRNVSSARDRQLECNGSRGGTQPIVNDVESIQFLYGVRRDDGSINYHRAGKVEERDEWENVVSVQVGLLLRSSNPVLLDKSDSASFFNLLDKKVNIALPDRRRLFRVYTTTIFLANKNRGRILNAAN